MKGQANTAATKIVQRQERRSSQLTRMYKLGSKQIKNQSLGRFIDGIQAKTNTSSKQRATEDNPVAGPCFLRSTDQSKNSRRQGLVSTGATASARFSGSTSRRPASSFCGDAMRRHRALLFYSAEPINTQGTSRKTVAKQ